MPQSSWNSERAEKILKVNNARRRAAVSDLPRVDLATMQTLKLKALAVGSTSRHLASIRFGVHSSTIIRSVRHRGLLRLIEDDDSRELRARSCAAAA
jgi:hypothetical protein